MALRQFMGIHGPGYMVTPNFGDYEVEILSGAALERSWEEADLEEDDYDRAGVENLLVAEAHTLEHPGGPRLAYGVIVRLQDLPDPKDWRPPKPE